MLNINQNFDLKAPVFNFDRDYFNSVEELNAYDTSNVPDHFVTNVAGILYQFTDGKWLPMIRTKIANDGSAVVNLANKDITFGAKNGDIPYMYIYDYSKINGHNEDINAQVSPKNISIETRSSYWDKNLISLSLVDDKYGQTKSTINIKDTYGPDETTHDSNFLLQADSAKMTSTIKNYGTGTISFNANTTAASELILEKRRDNAGSDEFDQITMNTSTGISIKNVGNLGILNSNEVRFGDSTDSAKLFKSGDSYCLQLGGPNQFKIVAQHTYPGADITGVHSITADNNPSATKVWATDGSTVDLTTKANASDVLLKKSASGGYYIEENSNELGEKAFAANSWCTASGMYSHAEGGGTAIGDGSHAEGGGTASGMYSHAEGESTASGDDSHAEGYGTASGVGSHAEGVSTASGDSSHAEGYGIASGDSSHAEGNTTKAQGNYSHAEGQNTIASGYCSHAQGCYNVENINAIHSVGIGNRVTRKNAEYIYAKNNKSGFALTDDPKNGYKYLIGVGGYDGISTDNSTYKSVQEVIADLTARIEQLEKLTANCVSISNVDEQTN